MTRPCRIDNLQYANWSETILLQMREGWTFDIDAESVGAAVYSARGPEPTYSLVSFALDLPP